MSCTWAFFFLAFGPRTLSSHPQLTKKKKRYLSHFCIIYYPGIITRFVFSRISQQTEQESSRHVWLRLLMSPVGGWAICAWATARPIFGGVNTSVAGVGALLEVSTQQSGSFQDRSYEMNPHQVSNRPMFATAL